MLLLGLAAVAGAEPLIAARGDSLETFNVALRLDGVDRSSAAALAGSYRRYLDDQAAVDRRFARLFRKAHIAVLRRFATPDVVRREGARAAPPPAAPVRLERVVPGDETFAYLARGGRRLRLQLAQGKGGWRIVAMHAERPGHGWIARPLVVPPTPPAVAVPDAVDLGRGSPAETMESFREATMRLRARRAAAARRQHRHARAIAAAFWGAKAARKALGKVPTPPAYTFRIGAAAPVDGGRQRVDVIATEQDRKVGHAVFDLVEGLDGWRIAAESHRKTPEGAFEPIGSNHGLIFFLGS